jgi:hypothetical protein
MQSVQEAWIELSTRHALATEPEAEGSTQKKKVSVVCVFITAVPITTLFAWGEGDSGGHVSQETTNRGLCALVCPSRTSERGGKGDCVKEGGGEEVKTSTPGS